MTLISQATSYSRAGLPLFKVNGKVPVVQGWQNTVYTMPSDIPEEFEGWTGNIGIALPDTVLVIDNDPRNHPPGDNPFRRLLADMDISLEGMPHVMTGGGGVHLYMKIPAGLRVSKSKADFKGIDFLSKGCYVVGAGSIHPKTKKPYVLVGDLTKMPNAPEKLINFIAKADKKEVKKSDIEESQDDNPQANKRYVEILLTTAPAVEGDNGDATLFQVCCKGRDLGLSSVKTHSLIAEHFNPRCTPEWSNSELVTKVENAYHYARGSVGQDTAEKAFQPLAVADPNRVQRRIRWETNYQGQKVASISNTVNYFFMDNSPLLDTLAYNEFNGKTLYMKKLPWQTDKDRKPDKNGIEWSDDDSIRLKHYLSYLHHFNPSRTVIEEAITEVAHLSKFHPVKDYLQGLTWDGVPRINKFLIDHAEAKDDEDGYVRAVSRVTLVQAVSRIFKPGCKADTVLVLEGPQGCGKSAIVSILGGEWLGVPKIDPNNKDTIDALRGRWIAEIAEMDVPRHSDAEALKAFVTRQTDLIRPAYGRRTIDLPRTFVFIGTINPDATGEYLHDNTGNRRWLPVEIGNVDFSGLEDIRDQLWAEAVDAYWNGEKSYITDPKLLEKVKDEQRKRQTSDSWADRIEDYIATTHPEHTTTQEVWLGIGGGTVTQLTGHNSRRIANVLRELGYTRKKIRHNGKPRWAYVKEVLKVPDSAKDLL